MREPDPTPPPDQEDGTDAYSAEEVAQFVQRAQRGDEEAFSTLYELHYDRIYRYMAVHVGYGADAEDLTEEVFLRMLRSIGSFRWQGAPFSAWLFRIARNQLVDHWRRSAKRQGISLDDAPPLLGDGSPDSRVEALSDIQDLRRAMEELTELQREVLVLRFISGLSVEETAKAMNRKQGAVKALQHSAIGALRRLMGRRD